MTYLAPDQMTINDHLAQGFLSTSASGKKQIFFARYNTWRASGDDDGHEMQLMEHEANITAADWSEYHSTFRTEF